MSVGTWEVHKFLQRRSRRSASGLKPQGFEDGFMDGGVSCSSVEASNDRGAKGGRKAVLAVELRPAHKGRHSAARLGVSGRWKTAWSRWACWQWAARDWVSESVRIARLVCSLRTSRNIDLSQPIGGCRPESRMREIRPSGLGGRGSVMRSSYPHVRLRRRQRSGVKVPARQSHPA